MDEKRLNGGIVGAWMGALARGQKRAPEERGYSEEVTIVMKKLRNFLGVLGVLSAVSTFFGLRGFLRWLRQRPEYQAEYYSPAAGSVSNRPVENRPAPQPTSYTGMRGFSPIPATGPEETGLGGTIPTPHEPVEPEDARKLEDWERTSAGPADSSTEGPTGATPRVVPAEIPHTGVGAPSTEQAAAAMGVDRDAIDTPARMPSQRGEPGTPAAAETPSTETVAGIHAGPLDLALVEALIAQDDLMAVIRERQAGHYRDPEPTPSSITPVDRMRFQHAADRLADAMGRVDAATFRHGSKDERTYRIIEKVRNALSRLDYTDADILRIDTEVRAEACNALWNIQHVVDWDKAYTIYGCKQG